MTTHSSGRKLVLASTTIAKSAIMNPSWWSSKNLVRLSQKFLWTKMRNLSVIHPSCPEARNQALPAWTTLLLKSQKSANRFQSKEAERIYRWTNSWEFPTRRFNYCKNNMMNKTAQRRDKSCEIGFLHWNLELIKEENAKDMLIGSASKISGGLNSSTIFWCQDSAKTQSWCLKSWTRSTSKFWERDQMLTSSSQLLKSTITTKSTTTISQSNSGTWKKASLPKLFQRVIRSGNNSKTFASKA